MKHCEFSYFDSNVVVEGASGGLLRRQLTVATLLTLCAGPRAVVAHAWFGCDGEAIEQCDALAYPQWTLRLR